MKKKYEKPDLLVESFQLDAAIAGSCSGEGYIAIGHWENTCGDMPLSGSDFQFYIFNDMNCEVDVCGTAGDGNDTICYHGPMFSPTGATYTWS